jgi:hypothetical protein
VDLQARWVEHRDRSAVVAQGDAVGGRDDGGGTRGEFPDRELTNAARTRTGSVPVVVGRVGKRHTICGVRPARKEPSRVGADTWELPHGGARADGNRPITLRVVVGRSR